MTFTRAFFPLPVVALLAYGCTTVQAPASPPASVAAPASAPPNDGLARPSAALTKDVHWARNAAEHRAVYLEVFRTAGEHVASLSARHAPGTWGVILDADETVIDNSEYEKARVPFGGSYDATAWNAWVKESRAPALPGATDFTARVHKLGGKVVIVTNRADALCPATRDNLNRVGLAPDLVLCQTATGDKNPRFDAVQNGTAAQGFPALVVVAWLGDNIQDFPHLTQQLRTAPDSAFARFGDTYFALPNAMYGSWEQNPRQ